MIKVIGSKGSEMAYAEADPWIGFKASWIMDLNDEPLYLFMTGLSGGYVEFKVHPQSCALYKVIVVDMPPRVSRDIDPASTADSFGAPIIDKGIWSWKVTPDYIEPAKRDVEITGDISYSRSKGMFSLWFSSSLMSSFITCGDVRVGISKDSELVCISSPEPQIVEPDISG